MLGFREFCDLSELTLRSSCHDDGQTAAGSDEGSGKNHIMALGQRSFFGKNLHILMDRLRFAGERSLSNSQCFGLEQATVCHHRIASLQYEDIARHQ